MFKKFINHKKEEIFNLILNLAKTENLCYVILGTFRCEQKELKCNSSQFCVPMAWVCDGENDCDDGSDERYCPVGLLLKCYALQRL